MKVLNISSIAHPRGTTHSEEFRIVLYAGLLALAAILGVGLPIQLAGWSLAEENGLLEILQMLVIFTGTLIFARTVTTRDSLAPVWAFAGLVYLTLTLRELDLRPTNAPDWLVAATLDQRHWWLAPLFIGAAAWTYRNRQQISVAIRSRDWRESAALVGYAMMAFLVSYGFEKKFFLADRQMAQFFEEAFELGLAVLLAGLAYVATRTRQQNQAPQAMPSPRPTLIQSTKI